MSDKVVELTHKGADSRGDMLHLLRFYGVVVWKLPLHQIMECLECVLVFLGPLANLAQTQTGETLGLGDIGRTQCL